MISIVIISKDEATLDDTLTYAAKQATDLSHPWEIVVVDASDGRLDHIRLRHETDVRWIQFEQPASVTISIPHQRNAGVRAARGEIVVFTDAGCRPEPGWLAQLTEPLFHGEAITAGLTLSIPGSTELYDCAAQRALEAPYLQECATINLAFLRTAFDAVGGFDEKFAYGSDIDFTWRLNDAGYRIRGVPDAVVRSDWGGWRRQLRRSYVYGRARMRLLRKHRKRLKRVLRDDPLVVVYPAFLAGLPLTVLLCFLGFPLILLAASYPAMLIIPAWRNRSEGAVRVLADHLTYGLGILAELVDP
jgi:glycosyltransferase involved in cell wall biosynthesis